MQWEISSFSGNYQERVKRNKGWNKGMDEGRQKKRVVKIEGRKWRIRKEKLSYLGERNEMFFDRMFVNRKERRRKGMQKSAIIWYMGKTSSLSGNTRERGDKEERMKRGIGPRGGCRRGRVDHFISLKNVDENGWKGFVAFLFLFRLNIEWNISSSKLISRQF